MSKQIVNFTVVREALEFVSTHAISEREAEKVFTALDAMMVPCPNHTEGWLEDAVDCPNNCVDGKVPIDRVWDEMVTELEEARAEIEKLCGSEWVQPNDSFNRGLRKL